MKFQRTPTQLLLALVIAADVTILFSAVPLARVSLTAARENAPSIIILGLLIANMLLLAMTMFAMWANGALILRTVRKR